MENLYTTVPLRIGHIAGILTIVLGSVALFGWSFDILVFKSILPGLVAMKANTALGFVLVGCSLSLIKTESTARDKPHILGAVLAFITLTLGMATLSEDLFSWDLGIDQLLFSEPKGAPFTMHSGRMSPLTAIDFILMGTALLFLHCGSQKQALAQLLALASLVIVLFSLGCYLFGTTIFKGAVFPTFLHGYSAMAIHTAFGFLSLSSGVIAITSSSGILRRWQPLLPSFGFYAAIVLLLMSGIATIVNGQAFLKMNQSMMSSAKNESGALITEDKPILDGSTNVENHASAIAAFGITAMFSTTIMTFVFMALRFQLHERRRIEKKLRESNIQLRRFKSVIDSMPAYVYIKDKESRYLYANQLTLTLFQCYSKDLTGCDDAKFFPPETVSRLKAIDTRVLQNGETTQEEVEAVTHGIRRIYWELKRPIFDDQGNIEGLIGLSTDISERKMAEEAMQLADLVYQNSSEAMAVTDADGNILSVNPAFTRITGYSPEEIIGKNPRLLSSGRQSSDFYQTLWQALNTDGYWQGEICNRRKNGEYYTEWLTINSIFNEDGSVHRRVALFTDITQKKALEQQIWKQANFDELTELPNRPMFYDRLEHEMLMALRNHQSIALILLDLDRFKEINDTLGHHYGDQLLKETAQRLKKCIRESDTVARLGGDEFTIILSELDDHRHAERVAQSILQSLAASFQLYEASVFISASIGIAFFPQDAAEIDQLLANADQAMYAAKSQGRNRYCYFAPAMQESMQQRRRLIEDLRHAVLNHQFTLYYQPIVSLKTGALVKAEALLRWIHPERGLTNPNEFIPLAEETGLIIEIGDWVFREAVAQLVRWQSRYGSNFQIGVNQSPVQFCEESHCREDWPAYLHRQGLTGHSLVVEITESLLMEDHDVALDILREFKKTGVQIAIDDFGTGYSSLAYLKKFDIDYLKIDQSFTKHLIPGSDNFALCEAIVSMAHKLGVSVIAEGVETVEQRDLLTQIGCDYGQGYLFSKPLPPDEFEVKLEIENCADFTH
jgi:diguanylate cyclase (GGDEF)-like protein/PAS domain S-box-containing protein